MDLTCPVCQQPASMRPQGSGMYGSKPTFVFEEHDAADGEPCAGSLKTDQEARELIS